MKSFIYEQMWQAYSQYSSIEIYDKFVNKFVHRLFIIVARSYVVFFFYIHQNDHDDDAVLMIE